MRRGEHVAHMGDRREGKSHLEDLGIDGKNILKRIIKKQFGIPWTTLIWFRIGQNGGDL